MSKKLEEFKHHERESWKGIVEKTQRTSINMMKGYYTTESRYGLSRNVEYAIEELSNLIEDLESLKGVMYEHDINITKEDL